MHISCPSCDADHNERWYCPTCRGGGYVEADDYSPMPGWRDHPVRQRPAHRPPYTPRGFAD